MTHLYDNDRLKGGAPILAARLVRLTMLWRRLLRLLRQEGGASPVIGVVLMVGTTVILGATVYGWSNSYTNVPEQGVKVLGLMPDGDGPEDTHRFVVTTAMPGLRYGNLLWTLDDEPLTWAPEDTGCDGTLAQGEIAFCEHGRPLHPRDVVHAGDFVLMHGEPGQTLRVVDSVAGAVVATTPLN